MKVSEIEFKLKKLTKLKDNAQRTIEENYRERWAVSKKARISRINESFYSVECNDFNDFKSVLNNCKPYQTSHRVKHGSKEYDISNPFKFTIQNGFNEIYLKFEFIKINNVQFWVSIDFNKIPESFKDTFFTKKSRALYDCESHYVSVPSHYKKFRDYRVNSFVFCSDTLSWYGGDKTIIQSPEFVEMINELSKETSNN